MFIDVLHRFVIDHIHCYYFCLRRTQSEESIIVRPRVKIANRNPGYDKMSYVGSAYFFGVQNSEFQYFLGFSEKLIFFGSMKILWIFFGVFTKLG